MTTLQIRPWTEVRAEIARGTKADLDPQQLAELRRELRFSRLYHSLREQLAEVSEEITKEQRVELVKLLGFKVRVKSGADNDE